MHKPAIHSATQADQPLHGQHAIVTGGSRGIGAAIAAQLGGMGASLTLVGRKQASLDDRAQRLIDVGVSDVTTRVADVTDAGAVKEAFADAPAPTILVNNAGGTQTAPFTRTSLAMWQEVLQLNLTGAFLCSQEVVPAMTEAGYGRIINIASTAGLIGYRYISAYCAAKHAVVGLTKALALELARSGVTVNAVCPGFTDTDMVSDAVEKVATKTGSSPDDVRGQFIATNPQGRLVTPEEVAGTVAWLSLPTSGAVTGQSIAIAGGEVM